MTNMNIVSVGHAAGEIRATVQLIKAVATELGIQPECYIDNVPHFTQADVERIAARIRQTSHAEPIGGPATFEHA